MLVVFLDSNLVVSIMELPISFCDHSRDPRGAANIFNLTALQTWEFK